VVARYVDGADKVRERHLPLTGNHLHFIPERIFKTDARLVTAHNDRSLCDGRFHGNPPCLSVLPGENRHIGVTRPQPTHGKLRALFHLANEALVSYRPPVFLSDYRAIRSFGLCHLYDSSSELAKSTSRKFLSLPKHDAHRARRSALPTKTEVIESTSIRAAHSVCGSSSMKTTARSRSKTTTMTHGISRTEMIELGILGLGLSLAVTTGFIALLSLAS
jgi:hypothetical protein